MIRFIQKNKLVMSKNQNVIQIQQLKKNNIHTMMQPIEFQRGERISLNRLRLEIDRRVTLITAMVKEIKPSKVDKVCAEKCCELSEKYCQTDEVETYQPLCELTHLSLSNAPSMKSLKSPKNLKRQSSNKNKENQFFHQSASSISSKNKLLLLSIEESEQEGLKTSRYLKNLQSEKKKIKPPPSNISTAKKSCKISNLGSNDGKKSKNPNINDRTKQPNQKNPYDLTSFESNKKKNFTGKKSFKNQTYEKVVKQPKTEEKLVIFNFNNSIANMSESKSHLGKRKNSINMNDDSLYGSSNNISRKYFAQFFSTNNMPTVFTTDDHNQEHNSSRMKRIMIGEEVQLRVQEEFENRLKQAKKKTATQPKTINGNIRVSLLKRLEDKHKNNQKVTK